MSRGTQGGAGRRLSASASILEAKRADLVAGYRPPRGVERASSPIPLSPFTVWPHAIADAIGSTASNGNLYSCAYPRSGFHSFAGAASERIARAKGEGSQSLWPLLRPLQLHDEQSEALDVSKSFHLRLSGKQFTSLAVWRVFFLFNDSRFRFRTRIYASIPMVTRPKVKKWAT